MGIFNSLKIFKKDYDASYFNTIVEVLPFQQMLLKQRVNLIMSLKSHGDLLEIGCGEGKLLNELKNEYNVTGIDISNFAIKKASTLIDKRNLKLLDIEQEDIEGKYDIIVAFDILEHLRNPQKVIIKIQKSLKSGGIFIFSVPNNHGFYGKISTIIFNYIDKTHISTYKREEWIQLVNNANFKSTIINQSVFGVFKSGPAKHFSFNLIIVAQNGVQ